MLRTISFDLSVSDEIMAKAGAIKISEWRDRGEALDRVEEGEESCGGTEKLGPEGYAQCKKSSWRRKENCGRVESKSDHFIAGRT